MAKGHAGAALFEAKEAEVFPAQRAREQFERFFVPAFTVLLCLLQGGGACSCGGGSTRARPRLTSSSQWPGCSCFSCSRWCCSSWGGFRQRSPGSKHQRLLRPGASYLLLNALLCAAVGVGIVLAQANAPKADLYVAWVFCGLLALIAAETLVALVLEVYRPRVKGKIERPLYESRLVGLLGQPEGLITTAAQAIDYQFGFKVSETWFYRFAVQAVLWLVPLQVLVLILCTAVVVIEPGEQALLERFGEPVAVLGPGAHLKWPWPIGRIYRQWTEQIQTFDVGFTEDPAAEKERAVLWTVAHSKEDNFLIADRDPRAVSATGDAAAKRTPPVSLLTVSIPVEYQITDLRAWAYNNEDAPALLQDLGTREVVRYLAGVNLNDLMTQGRLRASQALVERIQAAADAHKLGARIVSVALHDLHPPVKVGADYEKVVGALQAKQAKILAAKADEIRTNALAEAQATNLLNQATAQRQAREVGALAQAGLFTNQLPAFAAAPSVYVERAYLNAFTRATANARKYLLLTTNTHDVLTFDLQESVASDLLRDVTVPPPKAK